jgi:hypothetical protein
VHPKIKVKKHFLLSSFLRNLIVLGIEKKNYFKVFFSARPKRPVNFVVVHWQVSLEFPTRQNTVNKCLTCVILLETLTNHSFMFGNQIVNIE